MNRYTGIKCPHCGKAFQENDQVVVCPDCGAPYHRSCFVEMNGICKFADKHAEGYSWNHAENKKKEEQQYSYEDPRELRCSRCGTPNNYQNIFCEVCGTPLHRPESAGQQDQQNGPAGRNPYSRPFGAGPGPNQNPNMNGPFRTMGYNPYTTPYGGLSPDEEIDGVPAKDLAIFVGENTQYYLPKFKEMKTSGRTTINWSAFLLEFLFLIYRKMYLPAALVFIITNLISFGFTMLITSGSVLEATPQMVSMITMMTYGVSLASRFAVGFLFNRLYMNHCLKKIKALKTAHSDQNDYYAGLTKSGSVSRKAIIIICCIYLALSFIATYAMILFMPV